MATSLEAPATAGSPLRRALSSESAGRGAFGALAETAARALGTPWASLVLVQEGRLVLDVQYGFERAAHGAGFPFGSFFGSMREPFVVTDALREQRFAGAAVAFGAPNAQAYAGVPIVAPDGTRSGAIGVLAREPRPFNPESLATLAAIGRVAERQIEAHVALGVADAVRHELASVIAASPLAIVTMDIAGRVSSWSAAAERLSGYSAAEVTGRIPPWIPGGRNNRDFREMLSNIGRGATYLTSRSRRVRADGTEVDIRVSAAPMFGEDGSVTGFVTMSEDVDELERAERRLRLLESVVSRTSDAVFVTTSQPLDDPEIRWVNDAFVQMFGYEAHEIVGKRVSDLRSPETDPRFTQTVLEARRAGASLRGGVSYRRKNGEPFWCEASLSPVVEADGRCENWVAIARDVTQQRRASRLQGDRREILEMIAADGPMENTFAALVAMAERARPGAGALIRLRQGDLLYPSAIGERLGGAPVPPPAAVAVDDPNDPCARAVTAAEQVVTEFDGAFSCWSSPIRAGAGDILGTFAMYAAGDEAPSRADLRLGVELAHVAGIALERHEDRAELEFLATHDALTGLPNRKLFETRLDAAIAVAEKRGRHVGLGMIDLDRFKLVNDSLGHAVGDQLLRDVATRLARSVRPGDTLARLGGDEFVILIDDLDSRDDALEIAERVLLALVPSFACGGEEVFVHASMGLSAYPADASDTSGLLALGDAAMYEAKAQGREVAFHARADDLPGIARIALETSLNHALQNRQFEVLFQPQVELRSREIRGVEALLRWNHPTQGQLLPESFAPAAEDTGLIVPIGTWMLEEACRFARQWQDEGFERFVSVNIAARQFDRPDFVSTVKRTLANEGLEPRRLHLELRESLVMRSPEKAAATLKELKALGVLIVIDEFGTGYSSFHYLRRFPLDALKIDRRFVREIGFGNRAPNDEAIVRAIVGVARALDLKSIAEGVENEDQVAFLRAIGVALAQGDLFAPGLPAAAALRWSLTGSGR